MEFPTLKPKRKLTDLIIVIIPMIPPFLISAFAMYRWPSLFWKLQFFVFVAAWIQGIAVQFWFFRWAEEATILWVTALYVLGNAVIPVELFEGGSVNIGLHLLGIAIAAILMLFSWLRRLHDPHRVFEEGMRPAGPKAKPRKNIRVPAWLHEDCQFVYLEHDGLRTGYTLSKGVRSWSIRISDEREEGYFDEAVADLQGDLNRNPRERERRRLEEGIGAWAKEREKFRAPMSLLGFQSRHYGDLFVDPKDTVTPEENRGIEAEYIGMGSTQFGGREYSCVVFQRTEERECVCVRMAYMRSLWIGPGRCRECNGILSSLRHCPKCSGTGKCDTCPGDGIIHWAVKFFFEANTGIMLKRETSKNGKVEITRRLESASPDVLSEYAVRTSPL